MEKYLKVDREGMSLIEEVLLQQHYPEEVNDYQADMMLHALGADNRPYRAYKGRKYYHSYRNYYDAGGDDMDVWKDLVNKGYADHKGHFFHVSVRGIRVLEYLTRCRIWDDYQNVADCWYAVMVELMKDAVFCGYGCWLPSSSNDLSIRLAIPQKLVLETLHHLEKIGLAMKGYYGDIDDEGLPHCKHGWFLTKKAQEVYKETYEELKKAEMKKINDSLRGD